MGVEVAPFGLNSWVVVPGFMKCGSTTVFSWLETLFPSPSARSKEPGALLDRTLDFTSAATYATTSSGGSRAAIDASVGYLTPDRSRRFATNLITTCAWMPPPKFILATRDPLERSLSHIRHDVRRGRLGALNASAMAQLVEPGQKYFEYSKYADLVEPLLAAFPPEQFLILDANQSDDVKWALLLEFLGFPERARPESGRLNVTAKSRSFTRVYSRLVDGGLSAKVERFVPNRLRPPAARVLLRPPVDGPPDSVVLPLISTESIEQLTGEYRRFCELTVGCSGQQQGCDPREPGTRLPE